MDGKKNLMLWRDSLDHPSVRTWMFNQLEQQPKEMACLLRNNEERWGQIYGQPNKKDPSGNLYWYMNWLGLEVILVGGLSGTMVKYRPLGNDPSDEKTGLGIVSFYQNLLGQLF